MHIRTILLVLAHAAAVAAAVYAFIAVQNYQECRAAGHSVTYCASTRLVRWPMQIKMDVSAVREIERELAHIRNGANRAMASAINHTLGVTRTEASQEIRGQVKLKAAYVRERLRLQRATVTKVQGRITTPTRGVLMTRYPNTALKSGGVSVQIKPGAGNRVKMPGAFYVTFANGVQAIAIRTKHGAGLGRSEGLKVMYSPSVSQVFTDVKDDLQAPSAERLLSRMNHEAERLLNRQ